MKSEFINDILDKVSKSIQSKVFIDVEKTKVELKDLSTGGDWNSLKETICAYLNSDGGLIFCGIRERDKAYFIKGFDRNNETKIVDLQTTVFKNDDGLLVDLSDRVYFDYFNILDTEIVVIAVYPLSDNEKFVHYNGVYYERKLTQDKKILDFKIQRQKEYKAELEYVKEYSIVEGATINDFSLDKINKYVNLLNLEIRSETLKATLQKAKPFLSKQHFLKAEQVTTLGMLVCGDDPFHFLGARSEVNCYYDTQNEISRDKKIFRNDVISLMEESFKHVWGNIRIARTVKDGGKSEPEYPEKMVREVINNALAHRDYSIDGFVTISVEPEKWIEIKNPGSFKEKIKIIHTETDVVVRRLVPGIAESKNPKLASILKVFDKIENQGRGMASLINAALDNQIDLPYYEIKENSISLRVPAGKLVDDMINNWLDGYNNYIVSKLKTQLTIEHRQVLAYFYKTELLNKQRYYTILLSESNNHFKVIDELKEAGLLIEHVSTTEENPVFIIDRVLAKINFQAELISLLGDNYVMYDPETKETLNILYQHTFFNKSALKPAEMTDEVYRRIFGKYIDPKKYESLGRNIRRICTKLEMQQILIKNEKRQYYINSAYSNSKELF